MEKSKTRYRTGANFYFHAGTKKSTKLLVVLLTLESFFVVQPAEMFKHRNTDKKKNNWNC